MGNAIKAMSVNRKFALLSSIAVLLLTIAIVVLVLLRLPSLTSGETGDDSEVAAATITFLAPTEVATGKSFTATLNISNVTGFDACNYDIRYDCSVLRVTNVTAGEIDGTAVPVDLWSEVSPGITRVIQNVPGISGPNGPGCLAEIRFEAVGQAGTTSTILAENGVFGDINALEIVTTCTPVSVHVGTVLDAGLAASRTECLIGQSLTLTDTTSGGTPPYTYAWDFDNDGVADSTDASPTLEPGEEGAHTVSLTVTDALGDSDTETRTDYVNVYPPLDVDFVATSHKGPDEVTVLTFTNVSTGGKPSCTCSWDFNHDGETDSTAPAPTYTYATTGVYPVTLTVTDALGNVSTEIKIILLCSLTADGDSFDATDITQIERDILALGIAADEVAAGQIEIVMLEF